MPGCWPLALVLPGVITVGFAMTLTVCQSSTLCVTVAAFDAAVLMLFEYEEFTGEAPEVRETTEEEEGPRAEDEAPEMRETTGPAGGGSMRM